MSLREHARNECLAEVATCAAAATGVGALVMNDGMPRWFVLAVALLLLPWAGLRFYDAIGRLRCLHVHREAIELDEAAETGRALEAEMLAETAEQGR